MTQDTNATDTTVTMIITEKPAAPVKSLFEGIWKALRFMAAMEQAQAEVSRGKLPEQLPTELTVANAEALIPGQVPGTFVRDVQRIKPGYNPAADAPNGTTAQVWSHSLVDVRAPVVRKYLPLLVPLHDTFKTDRAPLGTTWRRQLEVLTEVRGEIVADRKRRLETCEKHLRAIAKEAKSLDVETQRGVDASLKEHQGQIEAIRAMVTTVDPDPIALMAVHQILIDLVKDLARWETGITGKAKAARRAKAEAESQAQARAQIEGRRAQEKATASLAEQQIAALQAALRTPKTWGTQASAEERKAA